MNADISPETKHNGDELHKTDDDATLVMLTGNGGVGVAPVISAAAAAHATVSHVIESEAMRAVPVVATVVVGTKNESFVDSKNRIAAGIDEPLL